MFVRAILAVALGVLEIVNGSPTMAADELTVLTSGGFAHVYRAVLPRFEAETHITVTTLSGASQGTGPKTIKHQLENGTYADLVILSKEGLTELEKANLIVEGSEVPLATTPLAVAVREGTPKPDIKTLETFKQALLDAHLVAMPGSTSGLFVRDEVFPKLGISDTVSLKLVPRGLESTGMLARGEVNLAIGPASELVDQPGIAFVDVLPREVQLVQVFTAAVAKGSQHRDSAAKLTDFLTSEQVVPAIRHARMESAGLRR
ncbi:MAG: substrate-binding domain-containing protein [Parafilimonas terrae]|nr:substrate-binding domain-containing protein [Parafilimonas terrae]